MNKKDWRSHAHWLTRLIQSLASSQIDHVDSTDNQTIIRLENQMHPFLSLWEDRIHRRFTSELTGISLEYWMRYIDRTLEGRLVFVFSRAWATQCRFKPMFNNWITSSLERTSISSTSWMYGRSRVPSRSCFDWGALEEPFSLFVPHRLSLAPHLFNTSSSDGS